MRAIELDSMPCDEESLNTHMCTALEQAMNIMHLSHYAQLAPTALSPEAIEALEDAQGLVKRRHTQLSTQLEQKNR
jgi:hypothetical protein